MAEREAIMRALMEAMGSSPSAPTKSLRPPRRPRGLGEAGKTISDADRMRMARRRGEAGKTISDADRMRMQEMKMQEIKGRGDMDLSPEHIKMLEQMMMKQQGARDAAERKAFPPPSMMNGGGEVQGYKPGGVVTKKTKKPKMGCVMKGRGGSYKGRS